MLGTKTLGSVLAAAKKTITDLNEVARLNNAKAATKEKEANVLQTQAAASRKDGATASIIANRMTTMLTVTDEDLAADDLHG
jgi:hypothetical protein